MPSERPLSATVGVRKPSPRPRSSIQSATPSAARSCSPRALCRTMCHHPGRNSFGMREATAVARLLGWSSCQAPSRE
eukprot:8940827-Alexandrium_andersonii.AAC.1